jgi:ribose transport system substrate-binding protein
VIGFSNGFCANTWRAEVSDALKILTNQLKAKGVVKKFINLCANDSIPEQIAGIDSMIAEHVNALLVIGASGTAIVPAIAKATREGIVTVPFNLPISGNAWDAYDGTDACQGGTTWATWLAAQVKGKAGGIVAIGGTPGNSYTAADWSCAEKVFRRDGTKVLAPLAYGDWEPAVAKSQMASFISAYGSKITGVYTDGGQNAIGVEEALLAAGDPLLPATGDTSWNGLLELWMKYHSKYPDFKLELIPVPPGTEAQIALNLAISILEGKHVPKVTILKPAIVDDSNIAQYVQPDLPAGVVDAPGVLTTADLRQLFG